MNKLHFNIIFLFLPLVLFSCKKDKLEGEKEILVGKWNWIYTLEESSLCHPPSVTNTFTPSTENKTVSIEFLAKGKVLFYTEGEVLEEKRVVFNQWTSASHSSFFNKLEARKFGIFINNNQESYIEGNVSNDILMLYPGYFPNFFNTNCNGCCYSWSYFVKE